MIPILEFLMQWVLGIIGLTAIVAVAAKWVEVGKKAMTPVYIIGVLMILINLSTAGVFTELVIESTTPTTTTPEVPTTVVPPSGPISAIEDVTVTFSSHDNYKQGSESTGTYNHRVFLKQDNGAWSDLGEFAEGATTTVSTYDMLKVIARFNESSTDGSGNATYPHMVETQMSGTKGTYHFDIPVVNVDNSPTITMWLKDKSVMASDNTEAMDASSEYKNAIQVEASNDVCIGDYFHQGVGNVMCFQYNQTVIQKMELDGAQPASTPTDLAASTGLKANCYYFPVICDNLDFNGNIITTTASTAPSSASGNDATVYIFDTSMDIDSDKLFSVPTIYGLEDEDSNDLGDTQEGTMTKTFYTD